jgi:hypothetical protein
MDDLTDRLAAKIALTFDRLMTVTLGRDGDDAPYWAIRHAIGFARTPDARLVMLAPDDAWYRAFSLPSRPVRESCIFGAGRRELAIVRSPDDSAWLVVGDRRAFNPHFWEPSVIPTDPPRAE